MYERYLELLKQHNLTTYQVSKATGIPESTLSMWKSRQDMGANLSVNNIKKLADFFKVPIEYFLE